VFEAVDSAISAELAGALTIADKQERESRLDAIKDEVKATLAEQYGSDWDRFHEISRPTARSPRSWCASASCVTRSASTGAGSPTSAPWPPRSRSSRACTFGPVRAWRDADPRRHHAEHARWSRSSTRSRRTGPSATCTTTTSPPFSTGETGRVGSPKRREIGHGALAERALLPVLPSRDEFPYAIRQVSEALSSNGSTSMGSVCASTLALLNAGRTATGCGGRYRDGSGV